MDISKEELGKLVKKARQNKATITGSKYTQAMLAKAIDKSNSYICDIENGRSYPSLSTLNAITTACEVSMDFFYNEMYPEVAATDGDCCEEDSEKYIIEPKTTDIKDIMGDLMEQSGLMLNGELLSEESKIALSNAIKLGLDYATQLQNQNRK